MSPPLFETFPHIVLGIILFLCSALISGLISFFLVRRVQQKFRERRRMRALYHYRRHLEDEFTEFMISRLDRQSHPMYRDYIGDLSCEYNAHSLYLRCAINPMGPCENCASYQPKT